jgi:hypothetical protein
MTYIVVCGGQLLMIEIKGVIPMPIATMMAIRYFTIICVVVKNGPS